MSTIDLYVGAYTSDDDKEGIYHVAFDPEHEELTVLSVNDETVNPTYLLDDGDIIYAGNEVNGNGVLSSFKKSSDGSLVWQDSIRAQGDGVCHITKHFNVVYGSNYGSGSIFGATVSEDGIFDKVITNIDHLKDVPRAHSSIVSPNKRNLYVADLGDDRIYIYDIQDDGSLVRHRDQKFLNISLGEGARHMALHPEGKFLYLVTEMGNTLYVIDINTDGTLSVNTKMHLPHVDGKAFGSDIKFDHQGKYLYVSYRGPNTIVVYELLDNDNLKYKGSFSTGGNWPRHFNITEDDKYLIIANQKSDDVTVLEILEDGTLSAPRVSLTIKKPAFILIPKQ